MKRLENKVAIITGAGSGIGRAMAHRFAAEGASVVAADVSGREEMVAEELGPRSMVVRADVRDEGQVDALFEAAVGRFGRVDVVCNNAGLGGEVVSLLDTPLSMVDSLYEVNLRGAFLVLRKSIAQMVHTGGGSIVNTASIASFQSTPGHAFYSATKSGIMGLTRAAATEYADRQIRVNALCPGPVDTPMIATAPETVRDRLKARIPMGRFGTPEEMANVALFLASDESSYVTGIGILADGGRLAGCV